MSNRRSFSLTVAAVAAVMALMAACGSGSSSKSSAANVNDPRSSSQIASDKASASGAILKSADLPTGWSSAPRSNPTQSSAETAADQALAKCAGIDLAVVEAGLFGGGARAAAAARSDQFADANHHEVQNDIVVAASEGEARQQLAAAQKPELRNCLLPFVNGAVQNAIQSSSQGLPAGVTVGQAQIEPLVLPGLQSDYAAYRSTVPIQGPGGTVNITLDLTIAVKSRTAASFTFSALSEPLAIDQEVDLANKVLSRATA